MSRTMIEPSSLNKIPMQSGRFQTFRIWHMRNYGEKMVVESKLASNNKREKKET